MFQANPNLLAELEARIAEAEKAAAEAAATFLTEKLGSAGSGTHWPGLPNPSSLPGEYPALQSGKLQASIDAQVLGGVWHFGSFNAPPEAFALEYPQPPNSPINRNGANGARPWLSKALVDPDMLQRVRDAMQSTFRR